MSRMNKVIAFLPAVILLAFWTAGSFIAGQQVPVPAAQAQTFSHENCQYPDRDTNPPDGCDNSDPCDPETIKDPVLGGRCKDDPAVQPTQPVPTPEPVKPAEPVGSCK